MNFADYPLERRDLGKSWFEANDQQREAWL